MMLTVKAFPLQIPVKIEKLSTILEPELQGPSPLNQT